MNICKVRSVTHSGKEGKRGAPRREGMYTKLLGLTVAFDKNVSKKGNHLQLDVLSDVEDLYEETFISEDTIVSVRYITADCSKSGDIRFKVETESSIFTLIVL